MRDDLRLAWKRLRNSPGFAITAVLTLALAVGANTAIFTVADAVLFRPLPYANPEQLFVVRAVDPKTGFRSSGVPFPYVDAIRQHHSGVAAVALRSTTIFMSHVGPAGGEDLEMFRAASDYFQVLGVRPIRGRLFEDADIAEGGRRVVLTYESWQRRFGGDDAIIGKSVRLGSSDRVVVGVLPPRFIFPNASLFYRDVMTGRADFATVGRVPPPGGDAASSGGVILGGMASDAIVRLKPGVTRDQAQAELDVLAGSVVLPRPQDAGKPIVLDDLRALLFPSGRPALLLLVIAAVVVLLIGCANLANMLLARAQRRERDLAIHTALGATRWRLMRPIFFETALTGISASVVAFGVTWIASDALIREVPPIAYGRAYVTVDGRAAWFALVLGLAAGLLFACVPAWRAARTDIQVLLRAGAARSRRERGSFGQSLLAAQVALAVLLAGGAASAAQSLIALLTVPAGFDPRNLVMLYARPPVKDRSQFPAFYDDVATRLRRRGDVVSVGLASLTPFDFVRSAERTTVSPDEPYGLWALPGYFETIGLRLREGRFPSREDAESDVMPAVLNASAARMLFPGGDALGRTFTLRRARKSPAQVIGIIDDEVPLAEPRYPNAYFVTRRLDAIVPIVVRTRTRSTATLEEIRRELGGLVAPDEAVTARWVDDAIESLDSYRNPRFQTVVLGSFATLALALASLGVFAVVVATIETRRRELAVRSAIGASPKRLVSLVMRQTLVPVAVGVASGALAAELSWRIVQSRIADVARANPRTLAVAAVVVVTAAFLAAWFPARRATRIDPVTVLRAE